MWTAISRLAIDNSQNFDFMLFISKIQRDMKPLI